MSYTVKSKNNNTQITCNQPTGSIMAYLGDSDPSGWVIMDGGLRVNTDGKYNDLINMSIGRGTRNFNYTPPNYKAAFLRGAGKINFGGNVYSGANNVDVSQNANLESHKHQVLSYSAGLVYTPSVDYKYALINFNDNTGNVGNIRSKGSGNESYPYNYSVNWILKL